MKMLYTDEPAKWKMRELHQIHTADPVAIDSKSCLYTIYWIIVSKARLSAHTGWICWIYLAQYHHLPFCGLIYIQLHHLWGGGGPIDYGKVTFLYFNQSLKKKKKTYLFFIHSSWLKWFFSLCLWKKTPDKNSDLLSTTYFMYIAVQSYRYAVPTYYPSQEYVGYGRYISLTGCYIKFKN